MKMNPVRYLLKKHFLYFKVRNRFQPAVQIQQRALLHRYQAKDNNLTIKDCGFRVFSQFEEDGLILFVFAVIGMGDKRFVDIGSDDGVNSNAANLYFNFGWNGLFMDSDPRRISIGEHFFSRYPHRCSYPPSFICEHVHPGNVNELIESAAYTGEIDLLSIDIDGTDYWVWKALEIISPRVVIIETHKEFGFRDLIVPLESSERTVPQEHAFYKGASASAICKLAKRKGYRLVGANHVGFNFIFVRNGLGEERLPEVSIESVLTHPSMREAEAQFEKIKDWKYVVDEL